MKILVLIKEVPDMQKVQFDSEKGRVNRAGAPAEINPFDESSLKTACETDGPHSGDRREEHGSRAGKWRHIDAVTGRT